MFRPTLKILQFRKTHIMQIYVCRVVQRTEKYIRSSILSAWSIILRYSHIVLRDFAVTYGNLVEPAKGFWAVSRKGIVKMKIGYDKFLTPSAKYICGVEFELGQSNFLFFCISPACQLFFGYNPVRECPQKLTMYPRNDVTIEICEF